jgi:hypothetical protein
LASDLAAVAVRLGLGEQEEAVRGVVCVVLVEWACYWSLHVHPVCKFCRLGRHVGLRVCDLPFLCGSSVQGCTLEVDSAWSCGTTELIE